VCFIFVIKILHDFPCNIRTPFGTYSRFQVKHKYVRIHMTKNQANAAAKSRISKTLVKYQTNLKLIYGNCNLNKANN